MQGDGKVPEIRYLVDQAAAYRKQINIALRTLIAAALEESGKLFDDPIRTSKKDPLCRAGTLTRIRLAQDGSLSLRRSMYRLF